jgi:hypothetical protein
MKQGATTHPKIVSLAELILARLSGDSLSGASLSFAMCRSLAVGVCEQLWHYASEYVPAGDIGKLAPARIADAVGWDQKDADFIIEAMVKVRLCDRPGDHSTLVIHDWSAHAQEHVHRALARARALFCDGTRPSLRSMNSDERDAITAAYDAMEVKKPRSRGQKRGKPDVANATHPPQGDRGFATPKKVGPCLNRAEPGHGLSHALAEPEPAPAAVPNPHPPDPALTAANERLKRCRAQNQSRERDHGIGSVAAAVGRPEHPRIVAALREFWPPPDPLPERLACHDGASIERVFWLIESARRKHEQGGMRKGANGIPGHIRRGIEERWEVPADWLAAKSERLAAGAGT